MARRLLAEEGLAFDEVDIEEEGMSRDQLQAVTGGRTVPQIVVNGRSIGGYENLVALIASGGLKSA